jgi:hypothetical protein
MLRRLDLVKTEVSEELNTSFIRVTRIGELGTTLAVTSNRRTLRRNTKWATSVLTRATRRNIPEDTILHSHRRENPQILQNSSMYTPNRTERVHHWLQSFKGFWLRFITLRITGRLTLTSEIVTRKQWRMPSSGMSQLVALVRTDVSEEHTASIIRVERISELRTK